MLIVRFQLVRMSVLAGPNERVGKSVVDLTEVGMSDYRNKNNNEGEAHAC